MKTLQTTSVRAIATIIFIVILALLMGCKDDPPASIYDANKAYKPQPVVDSILSSTSLPLSGFSTLTIRGRNFSVVPEENVVYFDLTKPKKILSSSTTSIVFIAPTLSKDSIVVQVRVTGADKLSDPKYYSLQSGVTEFGGFGTGEESIGIACDTAGSVYSSVVSPSGGGLGVRRLFSVAGLVDTSKEVYAPSGGFKNFQNMKMGPNKVLYGLRLPNIIYTIAAKGATPVLFVRPSGALFDFDFSKSGSDYYIWAGGNDTAIYRIKVSDKSITTYSFTGLVRSVRVFNNSLYIAAKVDSMEGVWKCAINGSNDLGPASPYFNLSAQPGYGYNGPEADAITFSSDGDMFLGTSSADAILLVHSSTSYEVYYPGLLLPKPIAFAWGKGPYLYYSRSGDASHIIIKINTLKTSAPYFGRGDQ
ncbi:MAG: IPT/TIG domain-containing protein [Ignavibacteriales bacterium]|nr:IPT/TIG domain-containing protein [Ignavibacteriales bacterium]